MHGAAVIEGVIRGYLGTQYTRDLQAIAVLAVQWIHPSGSHRLCEITDAGVQRLHTQRPDIHRAVISKWHGVRWRMSPESSGFRFEDVPLGCWAYIVCAYEGDFHFLGQHTHPMGHDGAGGTNVIEGCALAREGTRKDIIVPVFDRWYRDAYPEPNKTDPPTDPREFIPGVIPSDRRQHHGRQTASPTASPTRHPGGAFPRLACASAGSDLHPSLWPAIEVMAVRRAQHHG